MQKQTEIKNTITIARSILQQSDKFSEKPDWYKSLIKDVKQILVFATLIYKDNKNE